MFHVRRATPVMLVLSGVFVVWFWMANEEALLAWKSELDPTTYFAVLTIAGTVGIPTMPFYLLAGIVFGPWVSLLGASLSILGYQTLSYLLARGPLGRWTDRLRLAVERRAPAGWLKSPVTRIVLVRLTPGLPTALKNYVAASMGASLLLYLAVSWPMAYLGIAAVVVLGDSVATGNPIEALVAIVLLLPVAWATYRFRRTRRSHGSTAISLHCAENPLARALPAPATEPGSYRQR